MGYVGYVGCGEICLDCYCQQNLGGLDGEIEGDFEGEDEEWSWE